MHFDYGLHHQKVIASVVTIGTFDGVHRGHQTLIRAAMHQAKSLNLPCVVVLFEPQPKEYFAKGPTHRLYRLRDKVQVLRGMGVDRVLCLPFTKLLADLTAEAFVSQVLLDHLGVKHLVVGDDFHFGAKRTGDYRLLQKMGKQHGFSVQRMPTYVDQNQRVGSSKIREVMQAGDFDAARALLGRPYGLCGRIGRGAQLGRQMGLPTINIRLRNNMRLSGIFAVEVSGLLGQNEAIYGAGYVGVRPTLKGQRCFLEVHLLNFNGDCYGQCVCVTFIAKMRDDIAFTSMDALTVQMHEDVRQIQAFFKNRENIT